MSPAAWSREAPICILQDVGELAGLEGASADGLIERCVLPQHHAGVTVWIEQADVAAQLLAYNPHCFAEIGVVGDDGSGVESTPMGIVDQVRREIDIGPLLLVTTHPHEPPLATTGVSEGQANDIRAEMAKHDHQVRNGPQGPQIEPLPSRGVRIVRPGSGSRP